MQARVVTDTPKGICCGSKVTALIVKQPHVYDNTSDMMFQLKSKNFCSFILIYKKRVDEAETEQKKKNL